MDGIERRKHPRFTINLDVEWEGEIGRQKGMISDISISGCFVLCSGEVDDGEIIKIYIPVEGGMKIQFKGVVVNHVYEIGMGVRFEGLSKPQNILLQEIVTKAEQSVPSRIK